mmetsp:Transcript_48468/g.149736  ORF Transcript_48468/g.149736 Transcript_48468/m.149736 type:complete len:221 (-) Transcript_48468:13-675(-)
MPRAPHPEPLQPARRPRRHSPEGLINGALLVPCRGVGSDGDQLCGAEVEAGQHLGRGVERDGVEENDCGRGPAGLLQSDGRLKRHRASRAVAHQRARLAVETEDVVHGLPHVPQLRRAHGAVHEDLPEGAAPSQGGQVHCQGCGATSGDGPRVVRQRCAPTREAVQEEGASPNLLAERGVEVVADLLAVHGPRSGAASGGRALAPGVLLFPGRLHVDRMQ